MSFSLWRLDFVKHDNGWFVAWDQVIKFEWRYRAERDT
jgi:hypothetical protein